MLAKRIQEILSEFLNDLEAFISEDDLSDAEKAEILDFENADLQRMIKASDAELSEAEIENEAIRLKAIIIANNASESKIEQKLKEALEIDDEDERINERDES